MAIGLRVVLFNTFSNPISYLVIRSRGLRAVLIIFKHLSAEFSLLIFGNFIGLSPFTFTPSSNISVTFRLALRV